MIPFSVQCETCQAWLQVRSETLVDQIHSCPKCGGMVHLVRPPEPEPGEAELQNGEPPAESIAAAPVPQRRFALALGISAGALGLFGIAGLLLLTGGDQEEVAVVVEQPRTMPSASAALDPAEVPVDDVPVDQLPDADVPDAEAPVLKPASQASKVPTVEQSAELMELPELPPEVEAPTNSPESSEPTAAASASSPSQAAERATPKIDPLEMDPASLDLVMLRGGKTAAVPSAPAENSPTVPEPTPEVPAQQQRVASLDRALASRVELEQMWVERLETAPAGLSQLELARRLNDSLPELVLPTTPVAPAVRLWSELAGVPVTLDPAALRHAGLQADAGVTLRGQDETLGELLLAALRPLRLTYTERNGQLVIARLGAERERSRDYPVDDLLSASFPAAQLAEFALALSLPNVPAAQLIAGEERLSLTADAGSHFDLVIFLERLRRARGLPQATSCPSGVLEITPSLARLAAGLQRKATFSFISPTPLSEVLEHWRQALGIEILVDWSSAQAVRLGPQSQVRCSVRDQPWDETLTGVLATLGFTWRAVDSQSLQIVAVGASEPEPQTLDFYPLANARTGAGIAQQLTEEVPPATVRFDLPSSTLMVLAPGQAQRQAYRWLRNHGALQE